ncbi:phage tail tape measure protein [Acuticoccus kalidii]|uniref:phage tail tape measure protein n=1 Tax=Acuticoccus kalidii TaxID=2910977 RepID=UPI0034E302ED
MIDVATLGFESDSSGLVKAKRDLDRIVPSAKNAEKAADEYGKTAKESGDKVEKSTTKAKASTEALGRAFGGLRNQAVAFGAAFFASMAAAFSTKPLFEFSTALAEVSTLVNVATFDMAGLRQSALQQAAAFGTAPTMQVQAFYQAISAGASAAADAAETLDVANRLAIGGVTDITTATDGLTSIMNAYGDKVASATAVSDAMFVAMRAGKTTIGELSSTLGQVAPLAAQTGVSFDELTAAIAALTKGGISTSQAVTGVRAILAAVAKPTSEAAKLAKQLGLDFTASGLASKGFTSFLNDLLEATGGSTEQLSLLFGGVEALVPIMALSGQAGRDFAAVLDQMANKAGATAEAYRKLENTPAFQANRVWAALQVEVLGLTTAMGGGLTAALREVADNFGIVASVAKITGATLLVAFGPAILGAVKALTVAIGTGLVGAFRALTAAMMANPLGALAIAITAVIATAWEFRDEINRIFGVDLESAVGGFSDYLRVEMRTAFDQVKMVWAALPDLFGDIGLLAAERLVNNTLFGIRKVSEGGSWIWKQLGFDVASIPELDLSDFLSPAGKALREEMRRAREANAAAVAGERGSAENPIVLDEIIVPPTAGGGSRSAASAMQELTDKQKALQKAYADIVAGAKDHIVQQQLERDALSMTAEEAATLRYEYDLLNQARRAGIQLGPEQIGDLQALARGMAAADTQAKAAADAVARVQEGIDASKEATRGFIGDLVGGLREGKRMVDVLRDAFNNLFDRILNRAMDMFVNAIFGGPAGAGGAGGGGIFAALFGGAAGGSTAGGGSAATAVAQAISGSLPDAIARTSVPSVGSAVAGGAASTALAGGVRGDTIGRASQYLGLNESANATAISNFLAGAGNRLDPKKTAWCAAFADAVLAAEGLPTQGSLWARDFMNYGTGTENPVPGDLAVFKRGSGGHVGFFNGYSEDGRIRVIGGNQGGSAMGGGGVTEALYGTDNLLGFRSVGSPQQTIDAAAQQMATAAAGAAEAATNLQTGLTQSFTSTVEGMSEAGSGFVSQFGGALQSVVGGIGSALSSASIGIVKSLTSAGVGGLFANGAAFSNGNVVAFANGGVVGGPTMFPMSGGRTGLMGEDGPEGIVPLKRGRDGRLGVSMHGMQPQVIERERLVIVNAGVERNGNLELFVDERADRIASTKSNEVRGEIGPRSEAARRQNERRRIQPARGV